MEIFDRHWWEYFKVLYWSVVPPAVNELNKEPVSFKQIQEKHKSEAEFILNEEERKRDFLLNLIDKGISTEEERRTVIETKANSMISQTGLSVTLLVASLSFVSLGVDSPSSRVVILMLLCFAAINLVAAGLHARHVVSLKYPYPRHDLTSYFNAGQPSVDFILSQLFIIQSLSQINDVKATFLKFSHWFYKTTFVTLFLIALLSPAMFFWSSQRSNISAKVINISHGNNTQHSPPSGMQPQNTALQTKSDSIRIQTGDSLGKGK